jgi:hypothetical protein
VASRALRRFCILAALNLVILNAPKEGEGPYAGGAAFLRRAGIGSATRTVTGSLATMPLNRFVGSLTGPSARFGMTSCALSLQAGEGCDAQLRSGVGDQCDRLFGLVAGYGALWDGSGDSLFGLPRW